MNAVNINRENFENFINTDKPVLLDFYAEWCGPCRTVLPIVDEIANEREDIAVGKVNVSNERELASLFGVSSIPTLIVMQNGKIINQSTGARPKKGILSLLQN